MDKLLRDYAEKRRKTADAQAEMHAATRKMLQGEVSRTFGQETASVSPAQKRGLFWWSRVAWAGAIAVVIIGALFFTQSFLPNHKKTAETQVAAFRKEGPIPEKSIARSIEGAHPTASVDVPQSLQEKEVLTIAPAPVEADAVSGVQKQLPPPAPSVSADRLPRQTVSLTENSSPMKKSRPATVAPDATGGAKLPASNRFEAAEKSEVPYNVATAGEPPGNSSLNGSLNDEAKQMKAAYGNSDPNRNFSRAVPGALAAVEKRSAETTNPAALKTPLSTPISGSSTFLGVSRAKESVVFSAGGQRFQQQNLRAGLRENFQSPPQPNVLSTFQIVMNGSQVLVIDADGSIYEGRIEGENLEREQQVAKRKDQFKATPPAAPQSSLTKDIQFRVEGLSATLQQQVVFQGAIQQGGLNAETRSRSSRRLREMPKTEIASDKSAMKEHAASMIHGAITVGGTNSFKVEASATP